jgi:hypothetical protein
MNKRTIKNKLVVYKNRISAFEDRYSDVE